jgi:hypothetical protein
MQFNIPMLLKIKILLPLLLVILINNLSAQEYSVSGHVIDSATREPLAFVNMLVNNSGSGGMTDIDGFFSLKSNEPVIKLKLTYVGYAAKEYKVTSGKQQLILLSPVSFELEEVTVIAGENPAHRIIRNVLANREINDPANIRSFSYTSYDKMIFTAAKDTARAPMEVAVDTNDLKMEELMKRQHLFLMESVSEHKYLFPDKSYDKVIATKISGLSDPLFVFLLSQSQPESFYKENISIAGKNYLNPIAQGFDRHYFFWISDTLFGQSKGDSTFVISYRPLKGKNFDALKGLLYISSRGWAIANVIAEPTRSEESFSIRIQQMYELLDGNQWFPVQLNTDIMFNNMSIGSSKPTAIGKSYRKAIVLKPDLVSKEFNEVSVEVVPGANLRDDQFWNTYRKDSLTLLEVNTYRVIDSLGKVHNLDRMSKVMSSLLSGRIPFGVIDLDINKIYRYNVYEKSYLGLGLYTNNNLTRLMSVGGFAGYGFGDKTLKYGGSVRLNLVKYDALTLTAYYSKDLQESGGISFFDDKDAPFGDLNFRNFYISQWVMAESMEAIVKFRPVKYTTLAAGISKADKTPMYDYGWAQASGDVSVISNEFSYGYMIAGIRFAYKEKYVRNQYTQMSAGTDWPVFWLQYTGAKSGFLDGDLTYNRFDFKAIYSKYTKLLGRTFLTMNAGYVDAGIPRSELFNGIGSSGSGFTLYSSNSFSTMRPSEFLSDRYASLFVLHNFGKLLLRSKYFEPDISVAMNAGIGDLQDAQNHRYSQITTMEKGYYETGLVINNILKSSFSGIGIAAYYRMGPYSYPDAGKNLMIRMTLKYAL